MSMILGGLSLCCGTCAYVRSNSGCFKCAPLVLALIQVGIYALVLFSVSTQVQLEKENNQGLLATYRALSVVNGCSDDYTSIDVAASTLAVESNAEVLDHMGGILTGLQVLKWVLLVLAIFIPCIWCIRGMPDDDYKRR